MPDDGPLPADRLIGALASKQHGVVSRRQLLDAGLGEKPIASRVRNSRLLRLHRGVYAVGHAELRREGRWLAAVLASGPDAVLSHRSAASLHGLRPFSGTAIDVATPVHRASAPGIRVHARQRLDAADCTRLSGVPVTTVARTLVDLAGVVPADHLLRALRRAEELRTFDLHAIEAALARTSGRPGRGHAAMRAALAEARARATQLTRRALEERFLTLVTRARLPQPRTNVWFPALDFEADALWPEERVAVELDGWEHHRTRDAFHRDRAKANTLTLAGWTVLRFTHDDVVRRPAPTAAAIRAALAGGAPRRPPPRGSV
jgi:very-short-patch-repair endonuclease